MLPFLLQCYCSFSSPIRKDRVWTINKDSIKGNILSLIFCTVYSWKKNFSLKPLHYNQFTLLSFLAPFFLWKKVWKSSLSMAPTIFILKWLFGLENDFLFKLLISNIAIVILDFSLLLPLKISLFQLNTRS